MLGFMFLTNKMDNTTDMHPGNNFLVWNLDSQQAMALTMVQLFQIGAGSRDQHETIKEK